MSILNRLGPKTLSAIRDIDPQFTHNVIMREHSLFVEVSFLYNRVTLQQQIFRKQCLNLQTRWETYSVLLLPVFRILISNADPRNMIPTLPLYPMH